MTRRDPLLQPFRLKHLELKNRVMSSSHEPLYSVDGLPKERYRLYHEEKAKGGIALTMIGGSSVVDVDSADAFGNLHAWDEAIVPWFQALSDACHRYDCAVMCQITHLGRRTNWHKDPWLPVIAPSPVREPAHRAFPKEMEDHDLRRVVKAYGTAALRCKEGGLDGIEIECYGHLMDAFWSPATNKRRDAYGGSLDNRLRFSIEVLEEIRRQTGEDFVVGLRLVVDEGEEGTIRRDQGFEITRRLVAGGGVDFLNVIQGRIETDEALSHVIPIMGTPAAPYLELASAVKREFDLPVFHAARIADVATARHAVAEGHLDMVGMTRAHMADPHIVAKIERGEEQRIRPCVGASYCIDRIYGQGEALCLHSPATGREQRMPHTIEPAPGPARRAVVVGAGPAGLEAARVLAARGHEVTLFEAAGEPGGQVRLAAVVKRRREMLGIVDWLATECAHHGVDIKTNTLAEEADVLGLEPDVVVVATGGLPNISFLEDGEQLVTTTWDILAGQVSPGADVLLFDDNAAHPGPTCAEYLTAAGARLEFVSPERVFLSDVGGLNYPAYLKALYNAEATITLNLNLRSVTRQGNKLVAHLYNQYNKSWQERLVDQVVVEHGTLPMDDLYFALKPRSSNLGELDLAALVEGRPQSLVNDPQGRFQLFRVGDAVASRNIHAAIYESLRICKDL